MNAFQWPRSYLLSAEIVEYPIHVTCSHVHYYPDVPLALLVVILQSFTEEFIDKRWLHELLNYK